MRAARLRLEALDPDFWLRQREQGPLSAALARDLPDQAVSLLLERTHDPASQEQLIRNLGSRPDLAGRLLGREQSRYLARHLQHVLRDVALEALIHGEPALAHRLIADEALGAEFAEDVVDDAHAPALHLVADALTGAVPVPLGVRARLAEMRPDVNNRYAVRPLGAERIAGLVRVASSDPDPAARVLAARLMLASIDDGVEAHLVAAFVAADSWRLERDDWMWLGRTFGVPPGFHAAPPERLLALLEGHLLLSHTRATEDPDGAEGLARDCARVWEATSDPQVRGDLLRLFDRYGYVFVDSGLRRPWAAPTWRRLLASFEALSAGSGALAPLAGGVVRHQGHELREPARFGGGRTRPEQPPPIETRVGAAYVAFDKPDEARVRDATLLLLGRVGTPAERQAWLDVDVWGPNVDFAPRQEGDEPPHRFPLDDSLRAELGQVLAQDVDPHARDLAAVRLALAGGEAELAVLARHSSRIERLAQGDDHPLRRLEVASQGPERLQALLTFVADPTTAAWAAQSVVETIAHALLDRVEDEDHPLAEVFLGWVDTAGAGLGPDRFEGLAHALAGVVEDRYDARMRAALAQGRARLEGTAVGIRVQRLLTPK